MEGPQVDSVSPGEGRTRIGRAWEGWSKLDLRTRLAAAAAVLLVLSAIAVLTFGGLRPSFSPLLSELEPEEAAGIVQVLEEKKIPYELARRGAEIRVPAGRVDEARLLLAGEGLPRSGDGFELFDRNALAFTDFTERVAYQRALQGELSRTLRRVTGIRAARVHLSIPEPALFQKEVEPPSASILVELDPAAPRPAGQALAQTVASSVPGLTPERVVIATADGTLLWGSRAEASSTGGAGLDQHVQVEDRITKRLETLLAPLVGDRFVIQVTATLDPSAAEITTESYSPREAEAPVRVRRVQEETYGRRDREAAEPDDSGKSRYGRRDESVEYQLSREIAKTRVPAGRVKRLQVAVLVDAEHVPPRMLDALREAISAGAGMDEERGDRVVLQAVPFRKPTPSPQDKTRTGGAAPRSPRGSAPVLVLLGAGLALSLIAVAVLGWFSRRSSKPAAEGGEDLDPFGDEDQRLFSLLDEMTTEKPL